MKLPRLNAIGRQLRARRTAWAGLPLLAVPGLALAGPGGGTVIDGSADISAPDANTTQIDQHSNSAIINWQQFSVGSEEFVLFNQPSSSAVVLNRVIGGEMSEILGQMQANGRVFLVNPMGVLFGEGSRIDVGGLVASTQHISDADFSSGRYVFTGSGDAPVRNEGLIQANQGFVVLSAEQVQNTGLIQAMGGNVLLASGGDLTLNIDGSGLVGYEIDAAAVSDKAGITNLGQIIADGGAVVLHADVARELAGTVINNEGQIRAHGINEGPGGEIYLTANGGDIRHAGDIDVSGSTGGTARLIADQGLETTAASSTLARGDDTLSGGFVELSGHQNLKVRGRIELPGGHLLLDPTDITIGAGSSCNQTFCESDLETQLRQGTNVELVASNSIVLESLQDNELNGTANDGTGASLFMGIGSGTSTADFVRGSGGTIRFADSNFSIVGDSKIDLVSGSSTGTIDVGKLSAASLILDAGGAISTGELTTLGTDLLVQGNGGAISLGNVTASRGAGATNDVDVRISNRGAGTVTVGGITASSITALSAGNSLDLMVSADQGRIDLGPISVNAQNSAGSAQANVQITNNNGGIALRGIQVNANGNGTSTYTYAYINATRGNIDISGDVLMTATAGGGTASADFNVDASDGGITTQGIAVQADASSAGSADASIRLDAVGGTIRSGNLLNIAVGGVGDGDASIRLNADDGNVETADIDLIAANAQGLQVYSDLDVSTNTGDILLGDINMSTSAVGGAAYGRVDLQVFNGGNIDTGAVTINSNSSPQGIASPQAEATAIYDAFTNAGDVQSSAITVSANLAQGGSSGDTEAVVDLYSAQGDVRIGTGTGEAFVAGDVEATATQTISGDFAYATIEVDAFDGGIYLGDAKITVSADNGRSADGSLDLYARGTNGELRMGNASISVSNNAGDASAYAYLFADGGSIKIDGVDINVNQSGLGYAYGSIYAETRDNGDLDAGALSINISQSGGSGASAYLYTEVDDGQLRFDNVTVDVDRLATSDEYTGAYVDLQANRNGSISGGDVQVNVSNQTGDGSLYLSADTRGSGEILLGQLFSSYTGASQYYGFSSIDLTADGGDLTIAGLNHQASNAGNRLNVRSAGQLSIGGSINVSGGGGSTSFNSEGSGSDFNAERRSHFGETVSIDLNANDQISVAGDIRLRADARTTSSSFQSGQSLSRVGHARLHLNGRGISVGGDISADAVGDNYVELRADQSITVGGTTRVQSLASSDSFSSDGFSSERRGGTAELRVQAGFGSFGGSYGGSNFSTLVAAVEPTTVSMQGISVSGPNALAELEGDQITIGDSGIQLQTLSNDAEATGAYQRSSSDYGGTYESSFAFASLRVNSFSEAETAGILITGDTSVTGPTAFAALNAYGNIEAAGSIEVAGTGYISSDDGHFGNQQAYGGAPFELQAPFLDEGRSFWGGAALEIGAPIGFNACFECEGGQAITDPNASPAEGDPTRLTQHFEFYSGAASVRLLDAVTVRGIGTANARIQADAVTASNISVDAASNGYGTVQGQLTQFGVFIEHDGGSGHYDITRHFSNGANGAAQYSESNLQITTVDGGAITVGDVNVTGAAAEASLEGRDASILAGNVSIQGAANGLAIWQDDASYAPQDSAPVLADSSSYAESGGAVFANDFGDSVAASVVTGNLDISGHGLTGVLLYADSISTGNLQIDAQKAQIRTNDPLANAPVDLEHADAILVMAPGQESVAQTGSIVINSADAVRLAAQLRATRNGADSIQITAADRISRSLPAAAVRFEHPYRQLNRFDSFEDETLPTLPANNISAAGNLEFQTQTNDGFDLTAAVLAADGSLRIAGPNLELSNLILSGSTLDLAASNGDLRLNDVHISTQDGNFAAAADLRLGSVSINDAGSSAPTGVIGMEAGNIALDAGNLIGAAQLAINAGDSLSVGDNNLVNALDLSLSAGNTLTLDQALLAGERIQLTSSGVLQLLDTELARGEGVNAERISITADTASINNSELLGDQLEFSLSELVLSNSQLRAGNANFSGEKLTIGQTTALIDALSATASGELRLSGGSLLGQTLQLTGGSVQIDGGAQVSGADLSRIRSTAGNVLIRSSSLFSTSTGAATVDISSARSILLENALIQGNGISLSATNGASAARALTASQLEGPNGRIVAVDGSRIDALSLSMQAARLIDLTDARVAVGNGLANFGRDAEFLTLLERGQPSLLPVSSGPNAAFSAADVRLGQLGMAGDYLYIKADAIRFAGNIDAPQELFVHFTPNSNPATISIENTAASLGVLNLNAADHLRAFPGTTFAIGGSEYSGRITVGANGPVDLADRSTNFTFLADQAVVGSNRIQTAGRVALLGAAVSLDQSRVVPQTQQFQPQTDQQLESQDQNSKNAERGDKRERGSDESKGAGETPAQRRYVNEESNAQVALECS